MKINDSYEIIIDNIGTYILRFHYKSKEVVQEDGTVKGGNDTFKDIGYYPTLQQALKGCIKHGIIETDLLDVETVCLKMESIYSDIEKLCRGLK